MQRASTWVILAVSAVLFAFAVGAISATKAEAGGGSIAFFPTQNDLWSIVADGPNTWNGNGHEFVIQADSAGRLPVLTTIHNGSVDQPTELFRLINGQWFRLECGDRSDNAFAQSQSRFHQSIGVVLQPGTYMMENVQNGAISHMLLVSGYWARIK